jgi:hypothetical protein
LDNSSDPSLKYLLSKDEKALESVRRRLSGDILVTQPHTDRFFYSSESLKPRVTIHPKIAVSPRLVSPQPKIEPYTPLPEFDLVSPSTPTKSIPPPEVTFTDKELFEVEKLDRNVPEFLEVIAKETLQEPQKADLTMHDQETSLHESNLPEWQPVEEEQMAESKESHQKPTVEDIPEFERVDISLTSEEERPIEWEASPQKEEQIETPVVFIPTEPPEPSFQKLSKQQERAAKKAQRKKEREAKKLKKIELKRLKKEKREKEQEEKRTAEEPQPVPQPQRKPAAQIESIEAETPHIKVDYNTFKGIKSIDEKTAELLYKNGYFSIENIKDATIDNLVQIRGIKRKLAKQIKKEIEQQITETDTSEFIPAKQKTTKKKEKKKLEDSAEWESSPSKEKIQKSSSSHVCTYKGYTLYKRETRKQDGKRSTVHYFTKGKSDKGRPAPLPEGYHIAINKKTGVPYLKKKR